MRGVLVVVCCALLGLAAVAPVGAAGNPARSQNSGKDWSQRDTAVYVVSTVNLLRTRNGRPLTGLFRHKLGVRHYDVYVDQAETDLFFIQMTRADGTVIAALAYKMGWQKPLSLSDTLDRFGVYRATPDLQTAYRTDHRQLIGSFSSTMPA